MENIDNEFFDRADKHIHLANSQLSDTIGKGKVSASMMYAVARFNAWISACGWNTSEEMLNGKEETIEYFVNQYRKMLIENLDDYINNFDDYMSTVKSKE